MAPISQTGRSLIAARIPERDRATIALIALENERSTSREVSRAIRFYLGNLTAAEAFFRSPENRAPSCAANINRR